MKDIAETAKEMKRQYYREYRAKNKEKTREINRRYWEKKAREAQKDER